MTEAEILADLLTGVWEYKSGEFIEFKANGYSTGISEEPYTIEERFFEILIKVPSIGILRGKVVSYNYSSVKIIDIANSTYYNFKRIGYI
ncbi:hypothetical protein GCM10023149_21530 [Mucilaginibacter gynuensis]|uniref:Uncharacterized protein n=1 Tax=Mucilaginibacter gynuensis TaxID=1302236 RepID=A0ABP8GC78_9SPHI